MKTALLQYTGYAHNKMRTYKPLGSKTKDSERKRKAQHDKQRGNAKERGYDGKWAKARMAFLMRNPLCAACTAAGRTVPAFVVDHIKPHLGDQKLFWDANNWQSLCKPCHDRKTATEDSTFASKGKAEGFNVVLLAGAPGAGKSSYVRWNMQRGDVVVDVDQLSAAVGYLELYDRPQNILTLSLEVRDFIYKLIATRHSSIAAANTVWVLTTQASLHGRKSIANAIKATQTMVMDTTADVCASRLRTRMKESQHLPALLAKVKEWGQLYRTDDSEIKIGYGA